MLYNILFRSVYVDYEKMSFNVCYNDNLKLNTYFLNFILTKNNYIFVFCDIQWNTISKDFDENIQDKNNLAGSLNLEK